MGYHFTTTCWNTILLAGQTRTPQAREALTTLYQKYWSPLYFYLRKSGFDVEDAEDHLQGFFVYLLEHDVFKKVQKEKGRFRSFLLSALRHYLSDEADKARALKRGGGARVLSLDCACDEAHFQFVATAPLSPDQIYARQWAKALTDESLTKLSAAYRRQGKGDLFQLLQGTLTDDDSTLSYVRIAERLGMTPVAVRVSAHRMRKRFGALLREEIAQTVAKPEDVELELQYLFGALS